MTYNLSELKEAANHACMEAIDRREEFSYSAVNWADFGCTSAERWEDDQGTSGYRVTLEEADPSNREVGDFIVMKLEIAGFDGVDVFFEW